MRELDMVCRDHADMAHNVGGERRLVFHLRELIAEKNRVLAQAEKFYDYAYAAGRESYQHGSPGEPGKSADCILGAMRNAREAK